MDDKRSISKDENGHKVLLRIAKEVSAICTIENGKSEPDSGADFDSLFSNNPSPMGIYEIAPFSILKINKAAVQLYGFTEDELLSMTIQQLRSERELQKLQEFLHHYILGKKKQ